MAYARVICNGTYKAQGVSTRASASLMAAVVTHKMSHQLDPAHTFNGDQGNCGGDNRSATTAYEPGAGNTIMSYDSRCAPDDVGGTNYFHAGSMTNIIPQLVCAAATSSGNKPPSLTVPASNTRPTAR